MEFMNEQSNDVFCSSDSGIVFLHKPAKLDAPPIIDKTYIDEKLLLICNEDYVTDYFNDIINNHMRLVNFNGIFLDRPLCYECDYCHTSIKDNWYYCFHCYKDMCKMCYEEVNEEIAIKNGAKNYKDREKNLNECRHFNQIVPRPIYGIPFIGDNYCHVCNKLIESLSARYSVYDIHKEDSLDICMDCYQNRENAKNMVELKNMKYISADNRESFLFNYTDFNSLCYWIPIITDKINQFNILMNLNPDDKNYGKLCFQAVDDHGRSGYFIMYDESITLESVLQKLKEITDKGTCEYETYDVKSKQLVTKTAVLGSKDFLGPFNVLFEHYEIPLYYG